MRVTDRMIHLSTLAGLRANRARLEQAQQEAASGRRIRTVSDDPVDSAQVMRIGGQLSDIVQYRRNMTSATTRLSMEDVVLTSAREMLQRAREIAMSVETNDPADPGLQAALSEISQIQKQLVSLGNTQIGEEWLFGGGLDGESFQPDGTYVGGPMIQRAEIDRGVFIATSETGDLFTPAFQALQQLTASLQAGDPAGIAATVPMLSDAQTALLARQSEVGGRMRHINDTNAMVGRRSQALLDRSQALTDVDPAESILKVMAAQSAMERAYAAVQRTLTLSLADYLS